MSSFLMGDVGEIMHWSFSDMKEKGTLTLEESLGISVLKLV
jgi:hypothetical protein